MSVVRAEAESSRVARRPRMRGLRPILSGVAFVLAWIGCRPKDARA